MHPASDGATPPYLGQPSAPVPTSAAPTTRTVMIVVGVALLCCVGPAVGGLAGWGVYESQKTTAPATLTPSPTMPTPSRAPRNPVVTDVGGTESGLVAGGDGPVTVEVYIDFMCPPCSDLDDELSSTVDQLLTDRKIKLIWHPVAYLDRYSEGTEFSTRAASAARCAAEAGGLKEFGEEMLINQPEENTIGLTDDEIVGIGRDVGITDSRFAQCVRDHKYKSWVGHINQEADNRGIDSVPAVFVNGKRLENRSAIALTQAVADA